MSLNFIVSGQVQQTALPHVYKAAPIFLSALVLSFSVLIEASAGDVPFTLAVAQHLAVERSQQLSSQDFSVTATREMAIASAQLPDPILKLGIDNLPVQGPDRFSVTRDAMTQRSIGLMQEIPRADKRQLRAQRYEREAEKSLAEKQAMTALIQRETALAWLDRYYLEAMATSIEEQIVQAKLEIGAADSAYRAARGSQSDLLSARGGLIMLEDRRSEIQSRVRSAKAMLTRWTGEPEDTPLAGTVAIDSVRVDRGGVDNAALESQLMHHPQIDVFSRQEDIASTEVSLAQANQHADWSVEFSYSARAPAYGNMIAVGISIPLQWDQKNRQNRELSAKLASLEQIKSQHEDALRAHVAEVRAMLSAWEGGRERISRFERDLIPLSLQRSDAALAAYRGGKGGLADVLAARRNEIDVRLQLLQLELDTARWWAQINFLFPIESTAVSLTTNQESK